ncbi:MAG TPA: AmmeMemoRadiSam system protein B [Polyangiaceae bacterium]|nr:AmmeMemoRadiSam system protein B [Polyangiaceae bacterium]
MTTESSAFREIRSPAVAGRFYPGDPAVLARDVARLLGPQRQDLVAARAVMVPHAGYRYSGAIAGKTFARILPRPRAIVLCPNHTGLGAARSVSPAAMWELPGGGLHGDVELRELLVEHAALDAEPFAHLREHAAEVILPFLRALFAETSFVAVCLAQLSVDDCRRVARGIAAAVRAASAEHDVLIVASTDMSHYVPADVASREDALAIERVVAMDAEGLFRTVRERRISMCGYVPTTVALFAARELGAGRAELVSYGNSGEVTGDVSSVVGYAGALFI